MKIFIIFALTLFSSIVSAQEFLSVADCMVIYNDNGAHKKARMEIHAEAKNFCEKKDFETILVFYGQKTEVYKAVSYNDSSSDNFETKLVLTDESGTFEVLRFKLDSLDYSQGKVSADHVEMIDQDENGKPVYEKTRATCTLDVDTIEMRRSGCK